MARKSNDEGGGFGAFIGLAIFTGATWAFGYATGRKHEKELQAAANPAIESVEPAVPDPMEAVKSAVEAVKGAAAAVKEVQDGRKTEPVGPLKAVESIEA